MAVLALRDVCNWGTRQQTGYKASVLDASRWLGTARYITDIRCAMSFLGLSWFPDQKFALRSSWHVAVATMPNDPIFDGVARFPWSSDNSPPAPTSAISFSIQEPSPSRVVQWIEMEIPPAPLDSISPGGRQTLQRCVQRISVTSFDASGFPSLWRGSLQTGHQDSSGVNQIQCSFPEGGSSAVIRLENNQTVHKENRARQRMVMPNNRPRCRQAVVVYHAIHVQRLKTSHESLIVVTWEVPSVSL